MHSSLYDNENNTKITLQNYFFNNFYEVIYNAFIDEYYLQELELELNNKIYYRNRIAFYKLPDLQQIANINIRNMQHVYTIDSAWSTINKSATIVFPAYDTIVIKLKQQHKNYYMLDYLGIVPIIVMQNDHYGKIYLPFSNKPIMHFNKLYCIHKNMFIVIANHDITYTLLQPFITSMLLQDEFIDKCTIGSLYHTGMILFNSLL